MVPSYCIHGMATLSPSTCPLCERIDLHAQLAAVTAERDEARAERDFFDAERIKVVLELDTALAVVEAAREAAPFIGNYLGQPSKHLALETALATHDAARPKGPSDE